MARKKSSPDILRLEGGMNVYKAGELKNELLSALQEKTLLKLDLSKVAEMDSAGVQLLIASRRAAFEQGKAWEIVASSDVVAATLALLGLKELLQKPQEA